MKENKRKIVKNNFKFEGYNPDEDYELASREVEYGINPEIEDLEIYLEEADTSDISVPGVGVQSTQGKKRLDDYNPFGEDNKIEKVDSEKVLQEKFIKFVKANVRGARKFISNGKFDLKEFVRNQSYTMLSLLEKEFKKYMTEEFEVEDFDIENIKPSQTTGNFIVEYFEKGEPKEKEISEEVLIELFKEKDFENFSEYEEVDTTGNEDFIDGFGSSYKTFDYIM